MSGKLVGLVRQNVRRFTTSQKRFITREEVEKIHKKQKEYQMQSAQDKPIHEIAGKTHFYITSALGVLTLIFTVDSLYKLINRK